MKNRIIKILLLVILSFFLFLMIRLTLPYLAFEDNVAFLRIKQWVIHNHLWKFAFYTHVLTSCFALLAGFTQFSRTILKKYKYVHRFAGKFYVILIMMLSGPAGFMMALYANGGLSSQIAFLLLSVLWMAFTFQAYYKARLRDFESHRNFMIRSFALTFSAITLRAWKYILVIAFRPHPMEVYMAVAWLGWIPNFMMAEIYIRNNLKLKPEKIKTLTGSDNTITFFCLTFFLLFFFCVACDKQQEKKTSFPTTDSSVSSTTAVVIKDTFNISPDLTRKEIHAVKDCALINLTSLSKDFIADLKYATGDNFLKEKYTTAVIVF